MFRKRILVPRSDSPPPTAIPKTFLPLRYNHDPKQFDELISRGATLAFCETWDATFGNVRGIVVHANDNLKETYGSFVDDCERWMIWIGRRIKLEDDDDYGSLFMEELLDLIFTEDDDGMWITYREKSETPTYWVTRPKEGLRIVETMEIADAADEYDVWDGEEDDRDSSVGYAHESSEDDPASESASDPAISDCESTWWSDDSENEVGPEEGEGEVQVDVGQMAETVEKNKDV